MYKYIKNEYNDPFFKVFKRRMKVKLNGKREDVGRAIIGLKTIGNDTTEVLLGKGSKIYGLVKNTIVRDEMKDKGYSIESHITDMRKTVMTYDMDMSFILDSDDVINWKIVVFNSYDLMMPLSFNLGLNRRVKGQSMGTFVLNRADKKYKFVHLGFTVMERALDHVGEHRVQVEDRIKKMNSTKLKGGIEVLKEKLKSVIAERYWKNELNELCVSCETEYNFFSKLIQWNSVATDKALWAKIRVDSGITQLFFKEVS